VAEAKSSYNNGLDDSFGDSEGYELSLGRAGAWGEGELEGIVSTLLLDDGHGHEHGHSPSPSLYHTHRPGDIFRWKASACPSIIWNLTGRSS